MSSSKIQNRKFWSQIYFNSQRMFSVDFIILCLCELFGFDASILFLLLLLLQSPRSILSHIAHFSSITESSLKSLLHNIPSWWKSTHRLHKTSYTFESSIHFNDVAMIKRRQMGDLPSNAFFHHGSMRFFLKIDTFNSCKAILFKFLNFFEGNQKYRPKCSFP